ncbi:alpha-galactosidase A [Xylariales sp. PMI_506]|nr:alpha-galactosidase A [Xylariales sp. PMI_506]
MNSLSPEVISMETSTRDHSYFRIRLGEWVKYVIVAPGTLDSGDLFMPLFSLPPLPYNEDGWTVAHVFRCTESQELKFTLENRTLAGVRDTWHHETVDCQSLERVRLLKMNVFECVRKDHPKPGSTVIAKFARFEWEIPRIERETRAYRLLEGKGIGPQFLGHIHERGRVIGFLLEKLHGSFAAIEQLSWCQGVLGRFHQLGLLHGDINRYNFIVDKDGAKLVDFENYQDTQDIELMRKEMLALPSALQDESERGAAFNTDSKGDD